MNTPIIYVDKNKQNELVKLVDKIAEDKSKCLDTYNTEKQIDKIIYSLYDLTHKEIKSIEKS